MTERYSVKILSECIELQTRKGADYQNVASTIKQADYYRHGLNTIYDIMHAKMLRIRSLIEAAEANPENEVKFESISDSAKDLINYASFFASYAEGKMDGQIEGNDIFNRSKKVEVKNTFVDEVEHQTGVLRIIPTIIASDENYPPDNIIDKSFPKEGNW